MSTAANHEQPERADAEFIKRLARHYGPPPLTPGQRVAWHTALATQLEKRRHQRALFMPAMGAATVAALALMFGLGGRFELEPDEPPVRSAQSHPSEFRHLDDWEYYLLAFQPADDEEEEQHALLLDDYAAIESIFLDG